MLKQKEEISCVQLSCKNESFSTEHKKSIFPHMTTYTLSTMCFIKKLLNIQNSLKFSAIDILREINFDKF